MADLIKYTSKDHYEKFEKMVKSVGLTIFDDQTFGSKKELEKLFQKNEYLIDIPLGKFDAIFPWHVAKNVPGGPKSFSDNTCMYKHALIFHVIGAKPVFKD